MSHCLYEDSLRSGRLQQPRSSILLLPLTDNNRERTWSTHYRQDPVLSTVHLFYCDLLKPIKAVNYCIFYFTDQETEVQGGYITCSVTWLLNSEDGMLTRKTNSSLFAWNFPSCSSESLTSQELLGSQ